MQNTDVQDRIDSNEHAIALLDELIAGTDAVRVSYPTGLTLNGARKDLTTTAKTLRNFLGEQAVKEREHQNSVTPPTTKPQRLSVWDYWSIHESRTFNRDGKYDGRSYVILPHVMQGVVRKLWITACVDHPLPRIALGYQGKIISPWVDPLDPIQCSEIFWDFRTKTAAAQTTESPVLTHYPDCASKVLNLSALSERVDIVFKGKLDISQNWVQDVKMKIGLVRYGIWVPAQTEPTAQVGHVKLE
jgi:hypothetical protein